MHYHWPPELCKLVKDAVARLNRGKREVLTFFAACGVPNGYLQPWQNRLTADASKVFKTAIAEDIVNRINENPDANAFIRMRREVIRRIVETKSFDQCWENDQAVARGLVASIREMVDERDFFAKTIEATERLHEAQRRQHISEVQIARDRAQGAEALRKRFYKLFGHDIDGRRRGYDFQKWLTDLFAFEKILVREPFNVGTAEQIDGAISLAGHLYLVEAKWWADPLSHKDVADLYVKVSGRPLQTRGIVISGSGFTSECVEVCRQARMSQVILMTAEDIVGAFEHALKIADLIGKKAEYAMTEGRILVGTREIVESLNV